MRKMYELEDIKRIGRGWVDRVSLILKADFDSLISNKLSFQFSDNLKCSKWLWKVCGALWVKHTPR